MDSLSKLRELYDPQQKCKSTLSLIPSEWRWHKLLGFEKHRLKKEDFRNDKVDAAEMAAAEAGVAVYQVQVKPEVGPWVGGVRLRPSIWKDG